jgi:hypothetical protein
LLGEPEIQFVHQTGGLEGVRAVLALQVTMGDGSQIVIGHRGDAGERGTVAFAPAMQQVGDFAGKSLIGGHLLVETLGYFSRN